MSEYLKAFLAGVGSIGLCMPNLDELRKSRRGGFRRDARNLRRDFRIAVAPLRKNAEKADNGK